MKRQIQLFLTALMFYTRIPVPASVGYSEDNLNRSTRYFPLIGWIVGGVGALAFFLSSYLLPVNIAIIISMVATIWITGCFHEDGFADFCDAFGGGWTKQRILDIMKDSRIGTYGAVALILILGTKFFSIAALPVAQVPLILWAGHSISRLACVNMIYLSSYARDNDDSKAKPIGKKGSVADYIMASVFGILPLLFFSNLLILLYIPIAAIIVLWYKRYIEKWIGGYTGDCLGALQQITEVVFYLVLLCIW